MPTAAKHSSASARKRRAARAPGKSDALALLKADHKDVSGMVEKYENGRLSKDRKMALANLLSRRARRGGKVEDLLDETEVEHGSIKELVAAIENGWPDDDDLFDTRVKVLGECVKHHVKVEEGEHFPRIRNSDMDRTGRGWNATLIWNFCGDRELEGVGHSIGGVAGEVHPLTSSAAAAARVDPSPRSRSFAAAHDSAARCKWRSTENRTPQGDEGEWSE